MNYELESSDTVFNLALVRVDELVKELRELIKISKCLIKRSRHNIKCRLLILSFEI
jgi:hypothetical protein